LGYFANKKTETYRQTAVKTVPLRRWE